MNVTILTILLAAAVGQSPETSTERSTRIYVRTTPPGASIVLDGKQLGTSDGLFLVPPGVRKVTLEMEGYDPRAESVDVREGWVTRVEVRMKRSGKDVSGKGEAGGGTQGTTPRKVESQPQDKSVSSGVLEFRVAANEQEAAAFAQTGKDLAWYASAVKSDEGVVARTEVGQEQMLLWQTPEKAMTVDQPGERSWRIIEVSIMAEPERATRIGIVFDQEGGRRLRKLTGANIERRLAMLVDDRVVSCPMVRAPVGPRVEITGNFSKSELTQLTANLQAGMVTERKSRPEAIAQRVDQFKRLTLAMHNWHAAKKSFPPAAIYDENGTPLLSWRVAILPYLEQQALYDQFHLDEPWDSEHNRTLIEKMPSVFRDFELSLKPLRNAVPLGHTTYLVPVGEELVFAGTEGVSVKDITDGTSSTIMLVEVDAEHSVPWTQPADWQVRRGQPLEGVKRAARRHFTVGFCDGSVREIEDNIASEKLWKMLTPAGGEPIEN